MRGQYRVDLASAGGRDVAGHRDHAEAPFACEKPAAGIHAAGVPLSRALGQDSRTDLVAKRRGARVEGDDHDAGQQPGAGHRVEHVREHRVGEQLSLRRRQQARQPMLGAIDLFHALPRVGVVSSKPIRQRGIPAHIAGVEERTMMLAGVDWVICGGESGPQARAIEADWVRELRDQCTKKHVPFHFKQWGGRTPKANGKELDGREWCERPTPQFRRAA